MSEKRVSRAEKDYGLPRLTVDEAAKVLRVDRGAFWLWLIGELKPTPAQISKWSNDTEPLSEAVIRVYLTRGELASAASPPEGGTKTPLASEVKGRGSKRRAG